MANCCQQLSPQIVASSSNCRLFVSITDYLPCVSLRQFEATKSLYCKLLATTAAGRSRSCRTPTAYSGRDGGHRRGCGEGVREGEGGVGRRRGYTASEDRCVDCLASLARMSIPPEALHHGGARGGAQGDQEAREEGPHRQGQGGGAEVRRRLDGAHDRRRGETRGRTGGGCE